MLVYQWGLTWSKHLLFGRVTVYQWKTHNYSQLNQLYWLKKCTVLHLEYDLPLVSSDVRFSQINHLILGEYSSITALNHSLDNLTVYLVGIPSAVKFNGIDFTINSEVDWIFWTHNLNWNEDYACYTTVLSKCKFKSPSTILYEILKRCSEYA